MNRIVTTNQALEINGILFQRGDFIATPMGNGMRLTHKHTGNIINLINGQIEMDGDSVNAEPVYDYLKENGFLSNGGGDGQGVTWDDVTNKPLHQITTPIEQAEGDVAVYTQKGQLPVGMPEFPENAVPLVMLDSRAPQPLISDHTLNKSGDILSINFDGIILGFEYVSNGNARGFIQSISGNKTVDFKRYTIYGSTASEGDFIDSLSVSENKDYRDSTVYTNSQEMYRIWVRVHDTGNWWEIKVFMSGNGARCTMRGVKMN